MNEDLTVGGTICTDTYTMKNSEKHELINAMIERDPDVRIGQYLTAVERREGIVSKPKDVILFKPYTLRLDPLRGPANYEPVKCEKPEYGGNWYIT